MKIKRLEITGFKSFSERIRIDLPLGISAIVGPNGCGKSNVMDAIRWVMGEQSVKQLRGKNIQDIIFAGTDDRPAMNMAEVTMILNNEDGAGPDELKDFTEIELTRRVYRSGERSYIINRQPCRLKDINDIFRGTGMGSRSYAVIQQGNIGAITDAGPEERRAFVEEAAGVTRYKSRKADTVRNVEKTESNLVRVNDIVSEIERQMSGLKYQAKKAERYKDYQKKIRRLDIEVSIANYDIYEKKIKETGSLLEKLRIEETGHTSKLRKTDAKVQDIKLELTIKKDKISKQKSEKFALQRNIDRHENDLAHCRTDLENILSELKELEPVKLELESKDKDAASEIDELEKRNQEFEKQIENVKAALEHEQSACKHINNELIQLTENEKSEKAKLIGLVAEEARLKNVCRNIVKNRERIQTRIKLIDEEEALARVKLTELENKEGKIKEEFKEIKQEIHDLNEQIKSLESEVDEKRKALGAHIKSAQQIELDLKVTESKYTDLKKVETNFEWYKDGVRAVMQAQTGHNSPGHVSGITADIIEPEPGFETAVEAALGESLQYIIAKDQDSCIGFMQYLETQNAGRSGFIPEGSVKPREETEKIYDSFDLLSNHVVVKQGYEKIARALLGGVVIAPDIEKAKTIHNSNDSLHRIVTKQGHVISDQGIMIGGSKEQLAGILAKKQEIKQVGKQVAELREKSASARNKQERLESELSGLETELAREITNKKSAQQEEIDTEKDLFKISENIKYERKHLEVVQQEIEQLYGEAEDTDIEMSKYSKVVSATESEVSMAEKKLAHMSENIKSISSKTESFNEKIVNLKLSLTSFKAEKKNGENTLKRVKEFNNHRVKQLEQLILDISRKSQKSIDNREKIKTFEQALSKMYDELKSFEELIRIGQKEFDAIDKQLKEHDKVISRIKKERDRALEKVRSLEIEQSGIRIKQDNIASRVQEKYRKSIFKLKAELSMFQDGSKKPVREMEADLAEFREKISKIKDVNLSAIKEYDQLKERYDFLFTQKQDLIKAIEDLHKVIRKLNKITQEKFITTFEQINEKLGEVFPRLFEGGMAKLVLTQPDRPLESGVELLIQPPGKKIASLSLLSGGEKAMSAIAFIFSIFLIRPAAFCLMDEIDAPLDDSNIDRFNNLLQIIGEKSQIIMITHNKYTMEFADTLFGITMEKKGASKVVSVNFEVVNSG